MDKDFEFFQEFRIFAISISEIPEQVLREATAALTPISTTKWVLTGICNILFYKTADENWILLCFGFLQGGGYVLEK